jgi:hypothetical protein
MITYIEYNKNLTQRMLEDEVTDMDEYGFYTDIDSDIVLPNHFRNYNHINKKNSRCIEIGTDNHSDAGAITTKFNVFNLININRACFIGFSLSLIALRYWFCFM